MFQLKTIFGDKLSARLLETQTTQALIRCLALNRMTHLGMPESYPIAKALPPDAWIALILRFIHQSQKRLQSPYGAEIV